MDSNGIGNNDCKSFFCYRESLRISREQIQKICLKSKQALDSVGNFDSAVNKTEYMASPSTILLWFNSLFCVINEDYESRLLLVKSLASTAGIYNGLNNLSQMWKLDGTIEKLLRGEFRTSVLQVLICSVCYHLQSI